MSNKPASSNIKTIHSEHSHTGWDNALEPVLELLPGDTLTLETLDASGGQLSASSTAGDVTALDFSKINPVTGRSGFWARNPATPSASRF